MSKKVYQTNNLSSQRIIQDLWASRGSQALVTGVELDLFTHISVGNVTVEEISRAAKADKRAMERLLNVLVGLGYLNKRDNRYRLQPIAKRFLVRGSNQYMGDFAYETKLSWDNWSRLTDVIRSGRPVERVNNEDRGREFFPKLVSSLFPLSFGASRAAVSTMSGGIRKRIKNILDVAAGSGAWSLAFAEAIPGSHVTVVDYPEVTPITRQFVGKFELSDRYDYLEGNLREVGFGRNRYDLVILGHIIHSEGEKWGKKLLQKSYNALKESGLLLIAEIIPNDSRTGPSVSLIFSLNMLLHTEEGDVFTMSQYRKWLKDTGFRKVSTIEAPSPSPLILATK